MRPVNSRCFSGLGTRGQAENRSVFCHQLLPLVLTQGPLPWLRSWEEQKGTMATVPDRNPSEPLPVSKGTCAGAPNQDRALVLQCQCLQSACDPVPVSFTSCLPGRIPRCRGKCLFFFVDHTARGLPWCLSSKGSPANAGDAGLSPGMGRFPEEETATHSSILAWRIPGTEEPGGLQPTG